MKVIDGKFGKKKQEDEIVLADKIAMSLTQMIDPDTKGNFVMLLDLGDDQILISTDTPVADAVFLLEAAKLNLIMQPYIESEETLH